MRITVAICTWNRCQLLARTLDQLTRLLIPPDAVWDLLVVNNGATDTTSAVVRSFAGRLPLREVLEPAPGLSHARNRVLQEAFGDLVLCTDDDVLVDERWLSAFAQSAVRHPSAAVFGGPIEPWFPIVPDPILLASFPLLQRGFCGVDHGPTERSLGEGAYVWGANMALRRSAIDGLTFNPALGVSRDLLRAGEEKDFIDRVRARGGVVIWSPAMRVRHYVDAERMTLPYLMRCYAGRGRTWIREDGIPKGTSLLGAPGWFWRKCLTAGAGYAAFRLTPARVRSLEGLRDAAYWWGAIQECRLLHRAGRGAADGTTGCDAPSAADSRRAC